MSFRVEVTIREVAETTKGPREDLEDPRSSLKDPRLPEGTSNENQREMQSLGKNEICGGGLQARMMRKQAYNPYTTNNKK